MAASALPNRTGEWLAYVASGVPGIALAAAHHAGILDEATALTAFAVSFVGLNLAHIGATLSRTYLGGVARPIGERIVLPALLVACALLGDALGGAAWLLSAQYFLSLHHATAENYGLLRYVQRRSGRPLGSTGHQLDRAACILLPVGALIWRAHASAPRFHGLTLVAPPLWVGWALIAAGVVALAAYLLRAAWAQWAGDGVDPMGVGLVLITTSTWTWLLWAFEHPMLPLYAFASQHYVQHLFFVWRFEQRPEALGSLHPHVRRRIAPPRTIAWLAAMAGGAGIIVFGLTLTVVGLRTGAGALHLRPAGGDWLPPWTAAMIGVNYWHYWLDRRVWRLRTPEVSRTLALTSP